MLAANANKENPPATKMKKKVLQNAANNAHVNDMVLMAKQIREEAQRVSKEQDDRINVLEQNLKEARKREKVALEENQVMMRQSEEATRLVEAQGREIAQLKERERRLVEASTGWRQDSVDCDHTINQLKAALEQSEATNQGLDQQTARLEAEKNELAESTGHEIRRLVEERADLRKELEELQAELSEAKRENHLRQEANSSLEAQVRRLHEELETARKERDTAFEGHERLRVENEAMYRELRLKCELNDELQRHRKEDAKTLAEARREVAHLNELVAQLSGHANSKQKIQRVMKIEQDNVTLRQENLALRSKVREIQTGKIQQGSAAALPPQPAQQPKKEQAPAKQVVSKVAVPPLPLPTSQANGDGRVKSEKPLTQPNPPQLRTNSRATKRGPGGGGN